MLNRNEADCLLQVCNAFERQLDFRFVAGKPRPDMTDEERAANMETYSVQILCGLAR